MALRAERLTREAERARSQGGCCENNENYKKVVLKKSSDVAFGKWFHTVRMPAVYLFPFMSILFLALDSDALLY